MEDNKEMYEKYEQELSEMIYERSKEDISKDMSLKLARVINNRRKANVAGILNFSMEECADYAIKNYYA